MIPIKGHTFYNSVTNVRKMMVNNPNSALVNMNVYTKFGKILSICSQDIEQKRRSESIKGHDSVSKLQKNDD